MFSGYGKLMIGHTHHTSLLDNITWSICCHHSSTSHTPLPQHISRTQPFYTYLFPLHSVIKPEHGLLFDHFWQLHQIITSSTSKIILDYWNFLPIPQDVIPGYPHTNFSSQMHPNSLSHSEWELGISVCCRIYLLFDDLRDTLCNLRSIIP